MKPATGAYLDDAGQLHPDMNSAKRADLAALFTQLETTAGQANAIAESLLTNQAKVLAILATGERKRRAGRPKGSKTATVPAR